MDLSSAMLYLHDCYKKDNSSLFISHVLASKIKHKHFFQFEHLMNSKQHSTQLLGSKFKTIAYNAYAYRIETDLLYCSPFIVGNTYTGSDGLPNKIASPLFYWEAELTGAPNTKSTFTLQIKPETMQINFSLISLLCGNDVDAAVKLHDSLVSILTSNQNRLDSTTLYAVSDEIKRYNVELIDRLISLYPILATAKTIENELQKYNKPKDDFTLINSGALVLLKKSNATRGIIDELTQISNFANESSTIKTLLKKPSINTFSLRFNKGISPLELSTAQKEVVKSAANKTLTTVLGPPGTGKTFTIASIALEHLSRGESVLIASKMDHAVNVVGNLIENKIGAAHSIVRGGNKEFLSSLKKYLADLLSGLITLQMHENEKKIYEKLKKSDNKSKRIQTRISHRTRSEMVWGLLKFQKKKFLPFKKIRLLLNEISLQNTEGLHLLMEAYEKIKEKYAQFSIKYINEKNSARIRNTLKKHRTHLVKFNKAIRARTDLKQQSLFLEISFKKIIETFPIWLVNLSGIYNVLPLERELFDVAIIDEATQCDIASCIPILYRAKRAVIVGDTKQLKHISFLSAKELEATGNEHGLTLGDIDSIHYRNLSILDLALQNTQNQKSVFLLNEHFRSKPDIIDFSNKHFYRNRLRIMTERPQKSHPCVNLIECGGSRTRGNVNKQEVAAAVEIVQKIITTQKAMDSASVQTIGILSPFRKQTDYINKELLKNFTLKELQRHEILAGTAHTFQGEERDVMILSFCADTNSHANLFRFMSDPNVLNVSITRARNLQYILTSFDYTQLKKDLFIRNYIEYIIELQNRSNEDNRKQAAEDEFLQEVLDQLKKYPFMLYPDYESAGLTIDLLVTHEDKTLGIDLVGFPGKFAPIFPLEKYRIYARSGIQIMPLGYFSWFYNQESSITEILRRLNYVI
jgi:superfamily I DNA and/or RNA helicase